MSVSEGPRTEGGASGLSQLGIRLGVPALLLVGLLFAAQRWGEDDRVDRASFAIVSGTIRLADLTTPVEILRDGRGIPHLFARNERDAWFTLGFAHAQDRLGQMFTLRRRALGRSAESLGAEALPTDRLARLLGIPAASQAVVDALPEASRGVLEAYSAGVNARLSRIRKGLVPAPKTLEPQAGGLEDWRPADSIAVVKLLSWCMGGTLETTLLLDDLIQRLDSVPARPFFPGRASVDFGVAPDVPRHAPDRDVTGGRREQALRGSTRALCRGIGIPSGGAWVLEGSKTESGAPILVADWHFEPSVPGLFYEAHLSAEGLEATGVTMPGSPIFWAGRNPDFAWASVPASAPISDLFIETLREERGLYQNGTLWVPIETREEELRWRDARGGQQAQTMEVRSTRHGPLVEALWRFPAEASSSSSDGSADAAASEQSPARRSRASRALSWTGALPGDGLTSMLALLRIERADQVPEALAQHHEPVLAFAFADRRGGGGVQVAGWLANRPLPTGLVPVQGRLRSFDWREPVSIDSMPGARFGEGGKPWVVALDQPWPGRGGLDQTEWLWRPGDRAARLDRVLEERAAEGPLDLRDAAELLQDERAQRAPRVVAALVSLARRAGSLPVEAEEIARLLERWDGGMQVSSPGAAAYHVMIEHLLEALLREPFGAELYERYLETPHVQPQNAIERLVARAAKLRRAGGWTDEAQVTAAIRASLRATWVSLNHRLGPTRDRWAWGELHRMQFRSLATEPIGAKPLPALAAPGSEQTLAFARHRAGRSFGVDRAGLFRVAMDLGAPDRMLSSLAPGQTEHPGHPHTTDGITRWASARLSLVATSRLVIEEESFERLVLEPAL